MILLAQSFLSLLADLGRFATLLFKPRQAIAAENLILRRQIALFQERGIQPRRVDAATRLSLAIWTRLCDWRSCLIVVRPQTVIRWHRAGWRLFWRFKSRPGRPTIAADLRRLIRRMASENATWGQERIANELWLKLGIRVSPRTVRKYMPRTAPGRPRGDQRWSTFLRNHAQAIVACDFFVAVTATFRQIYVFIVMHHRSRRLLHFDVTSNPTAEWTLQQLPQTFGTDEALLYLLHDRDSIFSEGLNRSIEAFGLQVLKSPPRSPKAIALCERLIGTIRRECLDWLIPMSENHLRAAVRSWAMHYNRGRPHMRLGPGIPDPPEHRILPTNSARDRHQLGGFARLRVKSILGGLHHEYDWAPTCV